MRSEKGCHTALCKVMGQGCIVHCMDSGRSASVNEKAVRDRSYRHGVVGKRISVDGGVG